MHELFLHISSDNRGLWVQLVMHKIRFVALINILILSVAPAVAEEVDKALFTQGHVLFDGNCALCHQSSGKGIPPAFPALVGNENLQELSLIVTNIHKGQGAMPAFPQLSPQDIASLATYIRNVWGNEFGGVTTEAVEAVLERFDVDGEVVDMRSVWDGVYTKEQAKRGRPVYARNCTECHGDTPVALAPVRPNQMLLERQLDFLRVSDPGASGFSSAPPLSGGVFLRGWKGQTVANLYQFARSEMPQGSPGSLTDQQYADIIAYMFNLSRLPAGENELPSDPQQLNMIIIEPVASKLSL